MPLANPPQIEQYFYHGLAGLRSIQISEDGVAFYAMTLPDSRLATLSVAYWQVAANAHASLAGTYLFSWDSGTNRFTFARTDGGPANFWLTLNGSLSTALGFSASAHSGASSYTSDAAVLAIGSPTAIGYSAPVPVEESLAREHRGNRPVIYAHVHARMCEVTLLMPALSSDLVPSGRARIYPCVDDADPYDLGDETGYLDVYMSRIARHRTYGYEDSIAELMFNATLDEP